MTLQQLLLNIQREITADPNAAHLPAVIRYDRYGAAEINGSIGKHPAGHTPFHASNSKGRPTNEDGEVTEACVVFTCATAR